jgi:hypothetical protein
MPAFPRNIFQVWYQGCKNITKREFIENSQNWAKMNDGWNYQCVDGDFLEKACKEFSEECHKVYLQMPTMHMKIDLGRYVIVYLYGGMYVDMDAYILRPLSYSTHVSQVIDKYEKHNRHILGLSTLKVNIMESMVYVQKSSMLNNAILFSSPHNPVLKRFIEYIIEQTPRALKGSSNTFIQVNQTTGPKIFNTFFNQPNKFKDSDIIIFESTVFEPCDIGQQCAITSDTLTIHLFENSWLPDYLKTLTKYYIIIKPYLIPFIVLLVVYILVRSIQKHYNPRSLYS